MCGQVNCRCYCSKNPSDPGPCSGSVTLRPEGVGPGREELEYCRSVHRYVTKDKISIPLTPSLSCLSDARFWVSRHPSLTS